MTDKPFNEDLISGYLDDQLTPGERAAAESMLRDSDQQELLSDLASQSEQMGAVPKFDLGDKFAERLLADSRVETVFESLQGKPARQLKPELHHSTKRFSAAVAAIASLAALVLITLFVPQIPKSNVEVANKSDPTQNEKQFAGEERENIAPMDELPDSGVADDRPFETEEKELDTSEDENAPALAQIQLAGKDRKPKSEVLSRDEESKKMMSKVRGEPSNSAPAIEDKLNEKMERAANVRNLGTDDSRQKLGRRLDGPERSRKETASVGRGRPRSDNSKSQDRFFEDDNQGGAGGIEMASERTDQLVQNNATTWWKGKDNIQEVFEVNYSGGPEMIDEFQKSLVRNSIELQGDPSLGFQSKLEKMKGAIRGVEPSAGLSNRIAGGQQKKRQLREMMVTVTATPQHMADLIKDLNKKASIFNIGKGKTVVTRSAPAPMLDVEGNFDKDAGGRGSEAVNTEEKKVLPNGTANVMTREQLPAQYFDADALAKLKESGQKTATLDPLFFKNELENQRANYLLIIRTGDVTADSSIESSVAPARQQNK